MEIKRYELSTKGGYPYAVKSKHGGYVLYDDIKHLLERSDNSDYAVQQASPKLPSYDIVCDSIGALPKDLQAVVKLTYNKIRELGNFAQS